MDLGSAKAVDKIMVYSYNLTDTATILIEANATNVWTAPSFTLTYTQANSFGYSTFTTETYRYWRISISDAGNPDGYVEISNIYIGTHLEMPDIDTGVMVPYKTNSTTSKSTSGQLYSNRQLDYKAAKVTMTNIEKLDRDKVITFWRFVNITEPFWILIWESSLTTEAPIYCSLTKELEWAKAAAQGNLWTLGLEFEECF
jgi:hypothetical protein